MESSDAIARKVLDAMHLMEVRLTEKIAGRCDGVERRVDARCDELHSCFTAHAGYGEASFDDNGSDEESIFDEGPIFDEEPCFHRRLLDSDPDSPYDWVVLTPSSPCDVERVISLSYDCTAGCVTDSGSESEPDHAALWKWSVPVPADAKELQERDLVTSTDPDALLHSDKAKSLLDTYRVGEFIATDPNTSFSGPGGCLCWRDLPSYDEVVRELPGDETGAEAATQKEVPVDTPTKCSMRVLNRGAYSVPNLHVVCIVGGPTSNDYGANRALHHTIGPPDFSQESRCFQTVTSYQSFILIPLEIFHLCGMIRPMPWPSFTSSVNYCMNLDARFVWKPPWSLQRYTRASITLHELLTWLGYELIEELAQQKCGDNCDLLLLKKYELEIIEGGLDGHGATSIISHVLDSFDALLQPSVCVKCSVYTTLLLFDSQGLQQSVQMQTRLKIPWQPHVWKFWLSSLGLPVGIIDSIDFSFEENNELVGGKEIVVTSQLQEEMGGRERVRGQFQTVDKPIADNSSAASVSDGVNLLKSYRRAHGLCDHRADKWFPCHKCASTAQLHAIEEVWDLLSLEEWQASVLGVPEQLMVALSSAAWSGMVTTSTLHFQGRIQQQELLVLTDSGSTNTFLSDSLLPVLEGVQSLPHPLIVQVANGQVLRCTHHIPAAEWSRDWLQRYSPMKMDGTNKGMVSSYQGAYERYTQNVGLLGKTICPIQDTDIDDYVEKSCLNLKAGKFVGSERLRCPFCPGKKKQDCRYSELLKHTVRGEGDASNHAAKVKANHQALATLLKEDHVDAVATLPERQAIALNNPPTLVQDQDAFVWPWTGVLANVLAGQTQEEGGAILMKQLADFHPVHVTTVCGADGGLRRCSEGFFAQDLVHTWSLSAAGYIYSLGCQCLASIPSQYLAKLIQQSLFTLSATWGQAAFQAVGNVNSSTRKRWKLKMVHSVKKQKIPMQSHNRIQVTMVDVREESDAAILA